MTARGVGATALFRAARLLLPEAAPPGHDSVAVVDGVIRAVGPEAACRALLPHDAAVVDLPGLVLAPGFADAHVHPLVMSVFEQHLRFDHAGSIADVLDAVADRHRATEAGTAVVGFQVDDHLLAERRMPTAAELDAVAGDRPVVLVRCDGHHAVGSSAALEAVGLHVPGAEPSGGYVASDDAGRPTGLVGENAVPVLLGLMPEVTMEALERGARDWSARLLSQGVTALSAICQTTPEGPSGAAGELEAVAWSAIAERLPFDLQTILIAPDLSVVGDFQALPSLHDPARGRRVDAVKLFIDGTLGGASACMHHPFTDRSDTSGLRTMSDDDAYPRVEAAHIAGLQVCIHAIGDRANRAAADLYERVLREHPGPHRHRVEHASVLDEATVDSFARNDVTCVVQPISLRSEAHWLAQRVGPDRLPRTYPFRTLLDAGVTVAGSSDAPIESTDVLAAMAATVDRRGLADDQALTPAEALGLYTTGAARARRTEGRTGTLAPGARADLVALSAEPGDPGSGDPQVRATYIAGEPVFRHPDLEPT